MNPDSMFKFSASALMTVVSLCLLIMVLFPNTTDKSYGYIEFDGGYTALGYISGIKYEMNVSVTDPEGDEVLTGYEAVIADLNNYESANTIQEGWALNFDNGYVFSGSAQTFTLTINNSRMVSDGTLTFGDWLTTIESTMSEEKTDYRLKAEANLNFESAPAGENPLNLLKNIASQFL